MQKPINFDAKLEHSIDLIRKAEKIALTYDKDNGYFLAFSGGKDSQALYHVAEMGGVKFKAHFSPTSVDPPQLIRFIRKQYPDVEFLPLKRSIYDVAVEKTILPSMRIRWCCNEFKENAGAGKVTLIGIRHAESVRRAKRKEVEMSSHKFSGNLEEFEKYRRTPKPKRGRKPKVEKPSLANLDAIDNESITGCISGKDSLLISPIIDWTEKDVWYFLNEVVKVPHCELYDKGYKRIGCIMCPMLSHKQKIREMNDFPYVKQKWIETIKKIRHGGVSQNKPTCPSCRKSGGGQIRSKIQSRAIQSSRTMEVGLQTRRKTLGFSYIKQKADKWGGSIIAREFEEQKNQLRNMELQGFSDSSSSICLSEEQIEDQIAENIFDWWISGKSYKRWYAEKFLQLKLDL